MVISKSVPVLYGTAEWLPYLCGARSGRPHLYGARRYQPGSVWRALSDYRICTAHAAATRICMALRRYQPESGGCTGNAARICSARRRTTRICAAHAVMTPASMWCAPDPAKIDWICVVPAGAAPGSVGNAAPDDYWHFSSYCQSAVQVCTSSSNTTCSLPLPDAMAVRTVLLPPALPAGPACRPIQGPACHPIQGPAGPAYLPERVRTQDDSSSSSESESDVLAKPGKKKRAPRSAEQKASRSSGARLSTRQTLWLPGRDSTQSARFSLCRLALWKVARRP